MTGYLYAPGSAGEWIVVAGAGRLLVARVDGDAARAERCLAVLDADTSVSHIVDILSAQGLAATGPFALLFWVDGQMSEGGLGVIVRGTPVVTVQSPDGEVRVAAGGVMTWSEQLVDDATGFEVTTGEASDDPAGVPIRLPFAGGAVWATAVATDADAPALSGGQGARAASAAAAHVSQVDDVIDGETIIVPTRSRRREQAATGALTPTEQAPTEQAPTEHAPTEQETTEQAPTEQTSAASAADAAPVEETRVFHTTTSLPGADSDSAATNAPEPDSYDYLFGATIFRPVGQAAVEEQEEDDETGGAPASTASSAPDAPAPTAPTVTGDHDGSTVFSRDIHAAREESRSRSQADVDAARSASGSAAAEASGAGAAEARSGGYVLVLPDGRPQELNAPVIVGRAPSVSNVPASVLPHLVTLSADDISRNHVRVAVEGGTVVVTDLLSSNGTQVIQPGKPPLSLRGGEPTPVIVGTVVDLGSGITLQIAEA